MKSFEAIAGAVLSGNWLTLAETVQQLGKSQSTVERLVATNVLKSRLEPRPGRKPERLYSAEDVGKLADAPRLNSRSVAITAPRSAPLPTQLTIVPDAISALREMMTELGNHRQQARITEKLWLTRKEASDYSGIPLGQVKRLCEEGKLGGQRFGRSWRIRRANLEAFAG